MGAHISSKYRGNLSHKDRLSFTGRKEAFKGKNETHANTRTPLPAKETHIHRKRRELALAFGIC